MRKALFFLGILSDSDIDWIVDNGLREKIPAGTLLINEGEPINAMYIVLDGAFVVYVAALGKKKVAQLLYGEIIGEMSFVSARPPSATVRALKDSLVLSVPRVALAAKLEKEVEFAARFYHAIALFLAERVLNTVMTLGYGKDEQLSEEIQYEDELDPDILDHVTLAGARFDWLLRRLRGGGTPQ